MMEEEELKCHSSIRSFDFNVKVPTREEEEEKEDNKTQIMNAEKLIIWKEHYFWQATIEFEPQNPDDLYMSWKKRGEMEFYRPSDQEAEQAYEANFFTDNTDIGELGREFAKKMEAKIYQTFSVDNQCSAIPLIWSDYQEWRYINNTGHHKPDDELDTINKRLDLIEFHRMKTNKQQYSIYNMQIELDRVAQSSIKMMQHMRDERVDSWMRTESFLDWIDSLPKISSPRKQELAEQLLQMMKINRVFLGDTEVIGEMWSKSRIEVDKWFSRIAPIFPHLCHIHKVFPGVQFNKHFVEERETEEDDEAAKEYKREEFGDDYKKRYQNLPYWRLNSGAKEATERQLNFEIDRYNVYVKCKQKVNLGTCNEEEYEVVENYPKSARAWDCKLCFKGDTSHQVCVPVYLPYDSDMPIF